MLRPGAAPANTSDGMSLRGYSRETYEPSEPKDVEIQFLTANPAPTHISKSCP